MASKKMKSFFGDVYTQHTGRRGPTGTSRDYTNPFTGTKQTITRRQDGGLTVSTHNGRGRTHSKKY